MKRVLLILVGCFMFTASASAANSDDLLKAFDRIHEPQLDTIAYDVSGRTITHVDMQLRLDSGLFYPFVPIVIDADTIVPGGYFVGKGSFHFQPVLPMEQHQLRRFFDSDSVALPCERVEIFGSPEALATLVGGASRVTAKDIGKVVKAHKADHKKVIKDEQRYFTCNTLDNLLRPAAQPFLLINFDPDGTRRVFYQFHPHAREQVRLFKHFGEPGYDFMETACSYCARVREDHYGIHEPFDGSVEVSDYKIDATITQNGEFSSRIVMRFQALVPGQQVVHLSLHHMLEVDSILDIKDNPVQFLRWEDEDNRSPSLFLVLEKPLTSDAMRQWTFFTHGEVVKLESGHFVVSAGSTWYPTWDFDDATFDVTYRTHKDHAFVSCGTLVDSTQRGDTIITHWQLDEPTSHFSFNIGFLENYRFQEDTPIPVDVFIDKELHRGWGTRNMEREVGGDVCQALKLFTHYFGPCEQERIVASEILGLHGQAFPGFIHLSLSTFVNTDYWGEDRMFRAHEVAHQWFGVGVSFDSYHDQWLSEGFAEYCGLLYLQAAQGNDIFLDKMQEYRDDIYSARQFLFSSGEESGPIIQGYRTSSTKTGGDYDLIIYKKGAYVLHMLRNLMLDLRTMNEDVFFGMMKDWFAMQRGNRPSTRDFKEHVEYYTGIDMTWFFDQWLYEWALPEYKFTYDIVQDDQGKFVTTCHVTCSKVKESFKSYFPIEIDFGNERKAYVRVLIDQPMMEFPLPPLDMKPKKIRLNPFESVLAKVEQ